MLEYLNHLDYVKTIRTADGKPVDIFKLSLIEDDEVLDEWANHFRGLYCSNDDLERLIDGTGMSREEFLENIKFPDKSNAPGPSTRSGDFSEILIADYIEYVLEYFVPRTRYDRKINRNSSPMGSDLLAFKFDGNNSNKDEMLVVEVKAQASSGRTPKNRLLDAVKDAMKDTKRIAESLNAAKQRYIDRGDLESASKVGRFQNKTDRPYLLKHGAASVHSETTFSEENIESISISENGFSEILLLVVISKDLMQKIHKLYERASLC